MQQSRAHLTYGMILMLASSLFFSSMQVLVPLSGGRIPLMEQVFFRNLIALMIVPFIALRFKVPLLGKKRDQIGLFGRSISGFVGVVALFYASANAMQGDVSTLSKLHPFIMVAFFWLAYRKAPDKMQVISLFVSIAGVVLVANPTFDSELMPLLMAGACSVLSAVAYLLISFLGSRVDSLTIITHFSLFSVLACIPFLLFDFVWPTPREWFFLLALGVTACLGQITLTYAYKLAPAFEVSIYGYSGILFSIALGAWLLDEPLATNSMLGAGLVIVASVISYLGSKWEAKRAAQLEHTPPA